MFDIYKEEAEIEFKKIQDYLINSFDQIHTTRLNINLVSKAKILAYDNEELPLNSIANIQLSTARSFVIKPYDIKLLSNIDKGLRKHNPEFNPIINNNQITLSFPMPTEESRNKSVKLAKQFSENAKANLRMLRQSLQKKIKSQKDPEDIESKNLDVLDKNFKSYNAKIEELYNIKNIELLKI